MALIIPYRNRYEQLSVFVRQMHPILKRQSVDYRIFVVEQVSYVAIPGIIAIYLEMSLL